MFYNKSIYRRFFGMDEFLEKIKEILESEASILIENFDDVVNLSKER